MAAGTRLTADADPRELGAGSRDARTHRADRHVRDRGDLAVAKSPEVAQKHGLALLFGKAGERGFELLGRRARGLRLAGVVPSATRVAPSGTRGKEEHEHLRALSRRPPSSLDVLLRLDDLELDLATRVARRAGVPLPLTAREQALLECFLRNRGRVLSRGRIVEQLWDDAYEPVGNPVDVLVSRLRKRTDLPGARPLIHTVRGLGYMLAQ